MVTYVKPHPPTHTRARTHTHTHTHTHRPTASNSFSWEGNIVLYNTEVFYCIQMVPAPILITHLNAVNNLLFHSFRNYFNIILPAIPNHPSDLCLSGLQVKSLCTCNILRYAANLPATNFALHLHSVRAISCSSVCLFHQPSTCLTISSPKALNFFPPNESQDTLKNAKNLQW